MNKIKEFLTIRNLIIAICVIIFCVAGGFLLNKYLSEKKAQDKFESLSETVVSTEQEVEETIFTYLGIEDPGKVLDWEKLKEENEDIYAWIYIPNTHVDYPILQHESNDAYYLSYNLDGSKGYPGCIYTERINEKDFSDHNTLIYGHNMKNGTMFHDLHEFKDETFFKENRYIFIYTPEELLIYDIFASYKFTDAHILYTYDCYTEEGFQNYLDMVYEDYGKSGNFREGVEVTGEDHIITLSTCVGGEDDKRYVVQGVLVEYEDPNAETESVEEVMEEETEVPMEETETEE